MLPIYNKLQYMRCKQPVELLVVTSQKRGKQAVKKVLCVTTKNTCRKTSLKLTEIQHPTKLKGQTA